MTTYTTIPNTDIDQDSPVTQPLMTALRDNPLAIAEADSSVALSLLPSVLLGTLTTTSGSTQSLTSLDLTPFKTVKAFFTGVSHLLDPQSYTFAGSTIATSVASAASNYGMVEIDLASGSGFSVFGAASAESQARGVNSSLSTASTSIAFSLSGSTFDAGSVKIYGCK